MNMTANNAELRTIAAIGRRAERLADSVGVQYRTLEAMMDIEACHCNGNPLRLRELLDADDSNFSHDVFGVRRHIDRETGNLTGCFVPRYTDVGPCSKIGYPAPTPRLRG